MTDIGYHSVYLPESESTSVDRWYSGGSTAFVHDVMSGLPSEFDECDVLHAHLPWRHGFAGYNQRAGVTDGRTYPAFMAAIRSIMDAEKRPTVLVTGRHAARFLPTPSQMLPVSMPVRDGQPAIAYVYNAVLHQDWERTDELLQHLAERYDAIGDFCSGYGWAAKAFAERGKRFVMSDFNPRCIGYIAEHAPVWVSSGLDAAPHPA